MTTTDDILALAADAARSAPTEVSVQADADLAEFTEAAMRGMNSDVVRALRTLRPGSGEHAALPDSAAWRAWLSAAAAVAAVAANPGASAAPDPTVRFAVCAAATALGDDCSAAVTAGTRAAALVEAALVEAGLGRQTGWSIPAVSAVIGAGLAAGLMLRLADDQLRHTLGVCATQAAGLRAAAGTGAAPIQAGKAAFNAVEAAHLARLGFTSSRDPLAGRRGLFALFSP